jgi:hypothetical protein
VQPILGYLYKQVITVVKNADFTPYRENQLVYAKPLQIYKGVDNRFQFLIKNADQKPVSLLDSTVVFNLIDPTNKELVFSRQLNVVYSNTGTATTIIEGTMLNDISAGLYNYSILVINGEGESQIAYSDDNYNAQGQARLIDNVYPAFVPSVQPTILQYQNNGDTGYANVAYTSVTMINDRVKSRAVSQTAQFNGNSFVGSITIQGTQDADAANNATNWANIHTVTEAGLTGSDYYNFQGKFNAVRFMITQSSGNLNYILYRP